MERWARDEETNKSIIKMRIQMKKDFSSAIRTGYAIYNSKEFKRTNDENKYIVCYNIALCYKKIEMYNESLYFLSEALKYVDEDNQGYYRIQWLMNECEIELKIDKKEIIINRYYRCYNYYKSIDAKLMRAYVLYNIAKYKRNTLRMFGVLKIISRENIIGVQAYISYDKRTDIQEMLNDLKTMNYILYKTANNYLKELEVTNI